ncbi:lytic transglycosylase domain-containing protein [Bartonella sp. CB178]|uniref:lytic transglycosylase domain-containing protein n=1 Tax=Bartonella sp. CB178 TaxID=3112255 RepID=UPI00300E4487
MRTSSILFFFPAFSAFILAAEVLSLSAFAQAIPSYEKTPIPLARPTTLAVEKTPIPQPKRTYSATNRALIIGNIAAFNQLKAGLHALSNNDVKKTINIRDSMKKGSLDRRILTWAIGISSKNNIPSSELISTVNELREWPGQAIIQRNAERAFVNETSSARLIIQKFSHHLPLTAEGMTALARALVTMKQKARAHQIIAPWWHKAKLSEKEEELVLKKASTVLRPIDHLKRMQFMLYAHRISSAKRIAKLARAQSLFDAFVAVEKNDPRAAQKIYAADKFWRNNPLLQFTQIRYLRRIGQHSTAAALMMKTPRDSLSLINPDAWWTERRVLSREMLDLNQPKIAYRLVATHIGVKSSLAVATDVEFHAGWYALRFLHDPKLAMRHFSLIPQLSSAPLSISRGYYWMGKTSEILGQSKDAQHYFYRAAHFDSTYYGQLAASRLNLKKPNIPFPKPTIAERKRFSARKAIQAIQRLELAGYDNFAKLFYRELGKKIESAGELALLAVMAEKNGDYYTSLQIGKTAAFQGKNITPLSHPIGAIPTSVNISEAKKALVYAIARQESEFNPTAISKAGAQGILQLLPTTAKALAKKHSITWSPARFSNDISYNTVLSAHFLGDQLERFNGSYVLALIGYNAGPRRASEWIKRYGDPRGKSLDKVVDWIERIPYTETRNYVMRVMENYEVYKARLLGTTDIKADLIAGR